MMKNLLLPLLFGCVTASADAAGNDWMTALNGTLPLSQYSIPGTHDSGARYEPIPGTAKCQDLTITQQLEAGVRFLDIRCRHQNDSFNIYHGVVTQLATFTDVLNELNGFLNTNPREAVIMSVKEEESPSGNTRSFEATFDSYVALNPMRWLLGSNTPTLDSARGKIVLFRRFGAASTPKGIDASIFPDNTTFSIGGALRVQDHYVVPDNDVKWGFIQAILNEARYGGPNTMYVNFASGYNPGPLGLPSITTVSNNINPRLAAFFGENPSGRFGTILMDFADAARSTLIYNTNSPAGRAVQHPAYFMIVNRNSGKAMDLISGNTANGAPINQWSYDYGGPNQRWALAPTENSDHFRITSWVSGKCACIVADSTAAGAKLHSFDYAGSNAAQQFDLVDAGNGYFKLRNVKSNLVLEIENAGTDNDNRIQQNNDNGSNNQQWRLQPWGEYFIRSNTGKYLFIHNSGNKDGDPIVQNSWNNDLRFAWRWETAGSGFLRSSSLNALTRVIGVQGGSTTASAPCELRQYNPTNVGEQNLRIIPKTNGSFKFHFVHDDMAWDIPGGNTADLTLLQQFPDNANSWQEFQMERMVLPAGLIIPQVTIDLAGGTVNLSWLSQVGYNYQPLWSEDLVSWRKLTPAPIAGTGSTLTATDSQLPLKGFYRIAISPLP